MAAGVGHTVTLSRSTQGSAALFQSLVAPLSLSRITGQHKTGAK